MFHQAARVNQDIQSRQSQIDAFGAQDPFEPHVAFGSVLTTNQRRLQDEAMMMPKTANFGQREFENPLTVIKKGEKKKSVMDGETIRELTNNLIEMKPSMKEARKVIKKMNTILEMQRMDDIEF